MQELQEEVAQQWWVVADVVGQMEAAFVDQHIGFYAFNREPYFHSFFRHTSWSKGGQRSYLARSTGCE